MIAGEDDPSFWSSEVICVLYLGLLVYTGRYVLCRAPNQTRLFTLYTRFVCGGSLLRVVYFGVPDTWWGTSFVPSNYDEFSGPWWGNLATFLGFFCVANLLFDATFVLLVYYWASVCEDEDALPVRVFSMLVSTFVLLYLFIFVFYFFSSFMHELFFYSVIQLCFALILAVLYAWYARRIVLALKPTWRTRSRRAVNHRRSTSRGSYDSSMPTWQDSTNDDARIGVNLAGDRVWRITVVAAIVFTCQLGRAVIVSYQAWMCLDAWDLPVGALHWGHAWWVFISLFYILCEILCTAAVLLIMRSKPSGPARSAADLLHPPMPARDETSWISSNVHNSDYMAAGSPKV